jgi:hypothetical protein
VSETTRAGPFARFSDQVPLDLGHLSASAVGAIVGRIADGSAAAFADVAG